jgi:glutathione S-transferase
VRAFDVASSTMASVLRLGAGGRVRPVARQPEKLLEVYEFEGCPYCRRLREELSELDLDALVYPCPEGGTRFRPRVLAMGGKRRFPYLVDPNTGRSMYESSDIVSHLRETYGGSGPALTGQGMVTSGLASVARARWGRSARGGTSEPARPLELWSFEACPYCRLAREALCELELPYVLHNVARGSAKREAFVTRSGKMLVPYLVDPNTDRSLFESADIVRYLSATYGGNGGTS